MGGPMNPQMRPGMPPMNNMNQMPRPPMMGPNRPLFPAAAQVRMQNYISQVERQIIGTANFWF